MPHPNYSQVLAPPLWLLAFIYFLFLSFTISVWAALGNTPGLILWIFFTALLIILRSKIALRIHLRDGQLYVGRAHIELKYLGALTELNTDAMRLARGRDADSSAFLAIRFWQGRGIKIEIQDKQDATPYWLISTKKSNELVKAITEARDKI